jgi:hypothetical protein
LPQGPDAFGLRDRTLATGVRKISGHDANLVGSLATVGIPPYADRAGAVGRDALDMQRSGGRAI